MLPSEHEVTAKCSIMFNARIHTRISERARTRYARAMMMQTIPHQQSARMCCTTTMRSNSTSANMSRVFYFMQTFCPRHECSNSVGRNVCSTHEVPKNRVFIKWVFCKSGCAKVVSQNPLFFAHTNFTLFGVASCVQKHARFRCTHFTRFARSKNTPFLHTHPRTHFTHFVHLTFCTLLHTP